MIKDHEVIPDGWQLTNFGDKSLFEILGSGVKYYSGEKRYLSTSSIEGQNILYSEGDFTFFNRPSRANMQPVENSVWFAKMKNTLKVIVPDQDTIDNTILSTGFSGIRAKNVHSGFLLQVLLSDHFNNQKNLLAEGSTQEAINNTKVRKIKFLLPESFAEQQTIASILSKTDDAIAEIEKLIAKYNRIKTGLMQDLLTKGIDENGNIRSEETHEFKDSPLGRIPKEWDCEYLGSKVCLRGGYAFKSKDFTSQGIQLIRIGNLYNNQLSLERDPVFLPLEFVTLFPNFLLSSGDIILSMTGTAGKRDYGFAVQISSDVQVLLNQRVCKFIFQDSKVDKDYLLNILHAEFYLSKLYESVTGTKQANLNSENILNIYVPFPDIKEQKRIASKIVGVDKTISESKITLDKLSKLKVGLMQDLLSGKIRVRNITPNQSAS